MKTLQKQNYGLFVKGNQLGGHRSDPLPGSATRPPKQDETLPAVTLWRWKQSQAELHRVTAQRDELLAALKQIEKHLDPHGFADGKSSRYAFRWAQQAIAKCEANK